MYERVDLEDGTPVQFVGVYVLKWRNGWGQPTAGFREANAISKQDIKELHSLFLECGRTFMFCRIGEDTDDGRKMRLELEEPYNKLAQKWDRIVESLGLDLAPEGDSEYTDA